MSESGATPGTPQQWEPISALTVLSVAGCSVGAAAAAEIQRCGHLRSLDASGTVCVPEELSGQLSAIIRALPDLADLDVSNWTNAVNVVMAASSRSVRTLYADNCTSMDDARFRTLLRGTPNVKKIALTGQNMLSAEVVLYRLLQCAAARRRRSATKVDHFRFERC